MRRSYVGGACSSAELKREVMAALLWWLAPILVLAFACIDVWYFARMAVLYVKMKRNRGSVGRRRSKEELFAPYDLDGIVLPSDLDHMLHMNNSKYLREMDFGRVGMFVERGVYAAVLRNGGSFSLAAHCLRYRRSLTFFQRFVLRTKVLCWDEDAVYVEQRMARKSDGFVCAINLAKLAVRGTTVSSVMETWLGGEMKTESPPFPPDVESWRDSIAASSRKLQEERKRTNNCVTRH